MVWIYTGCSGSSARCGATTVKHSTQEFYELHCMLHGWNVRMMTSIRDPCQCTTTNTKGRNPAIDAYRHDPIGLELGQWFAFQGSRFSHVQVIGLFRAWSISSIVLAWGLRRRKDDQEHLQEEPLIPSSSLAPSPSFKLFMGRPGSWPGPVCRTIPLELLLLCVPRISSAFFSYFWRYSSLRRFCSHSSLLLLSVESSHGMVWYPASFEPG